MQKQPSLSKQGGHLPGISEEVDSVFGSGAKPGEVSKLEMADSVESSSSNTVTDSATESPIADAGKKPKKGKACQLCQDLEVSLEDIAKERAQLNPLEEEQDAPDDAMVCRFIRATGGNLAQVKHG